MALEIKQNKIKALIEIRDGMKSDWAKYKIDEIIRYLTAQEQDVFKGCGRKVQVGHNKILDCPINNQCGMTKIGGEVFLCDECNSQDKSVGGKDE